MDIKTSNTNHNDPFLPSDNNKWSLYEALIHINKFIIKKMNTKNLDLFKSNCVSLHMLSNDCLIGLFRCYPKLKVDVQNLIRSFYVHLEQSNASRYRNLTKLLMRFKLFKQYPWLEDKTNKEEIENNEKQDVDKPFSEACIKYEHENMINLSDNDKIEQLTLKSPSNSISTKTNACSFNNDEQYSDKSEEINSTSDDNKKQTQLLKIFSSCNETLSKQNRKRKSRWSSPPPAKESKTIEHLTPLMHFEKRRIKISAQVPLTLSDFIVLVSFFYKLEYMEQQLLIHQMKILENKKPAQAVYLGQFVRTTTPDYNENIIKFIPPPQELFTSRCNYNIRDIKTIDDIFNIEFYDDDSQQLVINTNSSTYKEFDFESEFL